MKNKKLNCLLCDGTLIENSPELAQNVKKCNKCGSKFLIVITTDNTKK